MARTKQRRTYLPFLPSCNRYSFTDHSRNEGWVSPGPGCKEQLAHDCYATTCGQRDWNPDCWIESPARWPLGYRATKNLDGNGMLLRIRRIIVATVNQTGSDCPFALKLIACHLLMEITSFLRETYQHMPRSRTSRQSGAGLEASSGVTDKQAAASSSRRWSSVFGSPGNSERSNSRSSQGDSHAQGFFPFSSVMH